MNNTQNPYPSGLQNLRPSETWQDRASLGRMMLIQRRLRGVTLKFLNISSDGQRVDVN